MARYVRYQSPTPNARGVHPGVFALVNGLAVDGHLTPEQELFRLRTNAWYEANFANPTDADPLVYDRAANPGAVAWFTATSTHLTDRVDGYLEILRSHGIPCERFESDAPGRVIYEDADQVVVVRVGDN